MSLKRILIKLGKFAKLCILYRAHVPVSKPKVIKTLKIFQ